MRKILNFILSRKTTIVICVLLMVFGFGWWVWATTVGTDIDISGSLKMGAVEVISSGRALKNVTAAAADNVSAEAAIITSGTFNAARIPTLTPSNCGWTADVCFDDISCPGSQVMIGVKRHTDTVQFPLCGTIPEQWYRMSINCCDI